MGVISEHIRVALDKAHAMVDEVGSSHTDPNLHLSIIAGMMDTYLEVIDITQRMPVQEDALEIIDGLYLVLGDFEQRRLEKELNGD